MKSKNEEFYYDSLDERDECQDLTESVPLYSGETPKHNINHSKKKKPVGEFNKGVVSYEKPKKSYLTMYYDKTNKNNDGSTTRRAICDTLSARSENLELSTTKSSLLSETESDLDKYCSSTLNNKIPYKYYSFYKNFLNTETAKAQTKKLLAVSKSTIALKSVTKLVSIASESDRMQKVSTYLKLREFLKTEFSLNE